MLNRIYRWLERHGHIIHQRNVCQGDPLRLPICLCIHQSDPNSDHSITVNHLLARPTPPCSDRAQSEAHTDHINSKDDDENNNNEKL